MRAAFHPQRHRLPGVGDPLHQRVQVIQPRHGRPAGQVAVVVAHHAGQGPGFRKRGPGGGLDRLQGLRRLIRPGGDQVAAHPGLYRDDVHRVRHDVVQFPRDLHRGRVGGQLVGQRRDAVVWMFAADPVSDDLRHALEAINPSG